jgi:DNA-binding response OmpR family regulator
MQPSGREVFSIREVAPPSGPRPPTFATGEASGGPEAAEKSPRILVVEDDFLIGWQIEEALSQAGFTVVLATSAEKALAIAAAALPEMAVMDIRLSGALDGIDAALELFHKYGLRCIFATAHSDAVVRARAAPAQPLGWLTKPYTMPSLVGAVRDALDLEEH